MSQEQINSTYFKDQFRYATAEVKNFSKKTLISVDKLRNLAKQCIDDRKFLVEILKFIEKKHNVLNDNREDRGMVHSNFLQDLFSSERISYRGMMKNSTSVYADYGGGNGDIAKVIGNQLGISEKKRILNVEKSDLKFNDSVTTVASLPDDAELGFVTAFHVIHHLGPKTQEVLDDIYKKMVKGGYFVIYEHAVPIRERDTTLKALHLLHFMYECVFEGKPYNSFIQDSSETYFYTFEEMKKLLIHTGFSYVAKKELNNRDKSYYSIYRKN